MLVLTAPQGLAEPTKIAELLKPYATSTGKPILACFMGGAEIVAANEILNRAGIPTFQFPDTATRAFTYMWRWSYNLRGLYETPVLRSQTEQAPDRAVVDTLIQSAREAGRSLLSEAESKQILAAYFIPTVDTRIAANADEAVAQADAIGYPVVVKLHSHTLTHKTELGGVHLDLKNASAVQAAFQGIEDSLRAKAGRQHFLGVTVQPMIARQGFELILGSSIDPQFGPVLLFGRGGRLVEIDPDHALALPPLNTTLARRMIEQTRFHRALLGVRGIPAIDMTALETVMVNFSRLIVEQPWIQEIDINPLLASADGLLALDARVVLHPAGSREDQLPHPVIRPYPEQYVRDWTMKDGTPVTIRPIRPEDEPLMINFHSRLSDRSVYLRYFQPLKLTQRTAHERLTRICFIDYDREMALVTELKRPDGSGEILAVGRLSKLHGTQEAEIAVLVRDEYQHKGLGTELVSRLVQIARDEKLTHVASTMLGVNREMRAICKRLDFKLSVDMEDNLINARATLS